MFRRALSCLLVAFACAAATSATPQNQTPPPDDKQKAELPDGDGRKILETKCTVCHGLEEIAKFKGYNTKDQWRDIVVTMVKYGAELKDGEAEVLVEYLGKNLSKK